mgnify:FL=1
MVPKEVEEYSRMHFFDEDTRQFWGPAGSEEEAYASIEKLDDNAYYIAYASLEKLTGYADFYNWAKTGRWTRSCGVQSIHPMKMVICVTLYRLGC